MKPKERRQIRLVIWSRVTQTYGLRAYLVSLDQNHLPLNIQFLRTSNGPAPIRTVQLGDNDFNEQLPMHGITKAALVKALTPPRG